MTGVRLLAIALVLVACSSSSSAPAAQPHSLSGNIDGALYKIEVPGRWNGTLFLYSHGYAPPTFPNIAWDSPGSEVANWMLDHGYAIAGSSYKTTGWAAADALTDQIALLDFFSKQIGAPKQVIAWGSSLGGGITAELIQKYPERFAGAIPMCGVVSGGVPNNNVALDIAYAFKRLLAPTSTLQFVNIGDPIASVQSAFAILNQANGTPSGQARIALVSAVGDIPPWYNATRAEPAATDYAAQESEQATWLTQADIPLYFISRAELEKRAGGNSSWNTGVDYRRQLANSIDRNEVTALYSAAGLNLDADLQSLNNGAVIRADPDAVAYVNASMSFDGAIKVPVLSLHTTDDGVVPVQSESAYLSYVTAAGAQGQLRQLFVRRAGHCDFNAGEIVAAAQALLARLQSGRWDDQRLQPSAMNAAASRDVSGQAAFVDFTPGPFLRQG
jgi:pimeloyl-ACP methyl ester carboxylesterase